MPTEAEVQTQWKNAVNVLEKTRAYADNSLANGGGYLDVLVQSFEGEYIPISGAAFVQRVRALMSGVLDSSQALFVMDAVLREYAPLLAASATLGYGSGYQTTRELFQALYQWMHDNTYSVETRAITYTTPSANGGNTGTAGVSRLTTDRFGYPLEACHVEKKMLQCITDQNSGALKWAESFQIVGETASFDGVRYAANGSGARSTLRAKHAGSGAGGSLLSNSSFSDFSSTATNKFTNWVATYGGSAVAADLTQDTTNYYRSHPNASTDASCKISMDNAGDSITLKQTLTNMRVSRLDPDTPYFLRVMVNKTVGTAVGGSVTLKLGANTTVTSTVAALSANWDELVIPFDKTCWLEEFGEDAFDIEIAWSGGTSGFMLFDDVIFCPWDEFDGTYWLVHQNNASPVANIVGDEYYAVDSGGAGGTGILQYWCWRAGLGYLPSDATPTIADPV